NRVGEAELRFQARLELLVPRFIAGDGDAHDAALARQREQPRHLRLRDLHELRHLVLAEAVDIIKPRRETKFLIRIKIRHRNLGAISAQRSRLCQAARPPPPQGSSSALSWPCAGAQGWKDDERPCAPAQGYEYSPTGH